MSNVVTLGAAVMSGGRCSLAQALELLAPDFTPMEAAAKTTQAINEHDHDRFPLYCNGEVVNKAHRAIAKVVLNEEDGRLIPDIESTGPGLGWARGLNWELEIDHVMALKPQPDTRMEAVQTAVAAAEAAMAEAARARAELGQARVVLQAATEQMENAAARAEAAEARVEAATDNLPRRRPGTKYKDDWPLVMAAEMIRLALRDPEMLKNIDALVRFMVGPEGFLQKEIGWAPQDPKDVRRMIASLLQFVR